MSQIEKIAIAFDAQAREILNNIHPELRNAAVNIAVKMLAKDPMYKKYFCIKCDDIEVENAVEPEQLGNSNSQNTNKVNTPVTAQPTQDWSDWI